MKRYIIRATAVMEYDLYVSAKTTTEALDKARARLDDEEWDAHRRIGDFKIQTSAVIAEA